MANPNQARDSRGRFTRTGSAESRRDLAERLKDRQRVEKARRNAELAEVRGEVASVDQLLDRLRKVKPRRNDDVHDVVSWEQQFAAAKDRRRRLSAKLRQLR